ncbi:MAG: MerR family transcriptional regulator [Nitrospirae bacterium]|nr:MerR family transcriptional regulator [Nitrospirota bacterium]
MKKLISEMTDEEKRDAPLFPIGVVAELIGITDQTIRLYEKHGLIKPARRKRNRFYSENDLKWLKCLRYLIHNKKISIEGIKKLLDYVPCWELTDCSEQERAKCSAYIDKTKPCWELKNNMCSIDTKKTCENCVIFLSKNLMRKS